MDTEIVVHKYKECYSALKKIAFESVLKRWMNLAPIIQSEISQKEKDKYPILMVVSNYIPTKIIKFHHASCYIFQHLTCSQDAFSCQCPSKTRQRGPKTIL